MLTCDGFEKAIIGYGTHFSSDVVIYSYDKCVNILMKRDKMTHKHLGDDNYD